MVYGILVGVLPSEGGPTIYRDYMAWFISRYAHKEHEPGRAELLHGCISTMQELIQQAASNGAKWNRVLKQTRPKSQKLPLNLHS